MNLSQRQKLNIIALSVYWPAIFILSHIPIPQLVYKAQVSDKSLHLLSYLILVFLIWFAKSPNKKVNWRKATVWWILFVVVWYGVFDELLQSYVGRQADVMDFFADLAGVTAGLILFSFFTFRPASLIVTAATIFLLTNLAKTNPAELVPFSNAMFHLFAYAFFTALWIQYIHHYLTRRPPQFKWLTATLALPVFLLLAVKVSAIAMDRHFGLQNLILAAAGIAITVNTAFIIALVRKNFTRRSLGGKPDAS